MEPDMDQQCGSSCATKHTKILKKAQKQEYKTILERWFYDGKYRKSVSDIGGMSKVWLQCDKIALEDHTYTATREEVGTNWTQTVYKDHWISAVTSKMRSKLARDCTMSIQQSLEVEKTISPEQQVRQRRDQQFEGLDEYDYRLEASAGWRYYPSSTTHSSSSSSSRWQPSSDLWSMWNWDSWKSSSWSEQCICPSLIVLDEWFLFCLPEI